MGRNENLHVLLNAPKEVTCPKCGKKYENGWDDCDVEDVLQRVYDGGGWSLDEYCPHCEAEFTIVLDIHVTLKILEGKEDE